MELEIIKKKIELMGLKKSHVAKQIGCRPDELSHFLGGKRKLRPDVNTRLIAYLS